MARPRQGPEDEWLLQEPAQGLRLLGEADSVRLRGAELDSGELRELRAAEPRTRLGRLLPILVPQLLELAAAYAEPGAIRIPYDTFVDLEARGIDAFADVAPWAPFALEVESRGSLGRAELAFFPRFYLGARVVHLERRGCFVRHAGAIHRLDPRAFALLDAVDAFNQTAEERRASPEALRLFVSIRRLAEAADIRLDEYLASERVLIPARIGLEVCHEEGGRASFAPRIEGAPAIAMRQAFLASNDAQPVYSLDAGNGRIRVVLDDTQREVLRRMQRVRHVGGEARAAVLRDPDAVFDGVAAAVEVPVERSDAGRAPELDPNGDREGQHAAGEMPPAIGQEPERDEDSAPRVERDFQSRKPRPLGEIPATECETDAPDLPRALAPGVRLKDHQRDGIAWLQRSFRLERTGCLLADDMGLGKTLQVLVFLAWLIERGELGGPGPASDAGPWDPILIVAPLMLLDSATWVGDMRKFFEHGGAVFEPCLTLHGMALAEMRHDHAAGREALVGRPVLDLERLRRHRVVLTNYETITNYRHSFATMPWTVIVTDEAQEHKTPETKVSRALKSLRARFRIAATGTPVETRLRDVWNLFDFLQPGRRLLGDVAQFCRDYEAPGAVGALKARLGFGRLDALLLRREKSMLADLPAKRTHVLDADLSSRQRDWHLDLVNRARTGQPGLHPLALVQHLMRLYQHPALFPTYDPPRTAREAVASCPKLARVVDRLREIRALGEKALVFTRILDMQHLLSVVLQAELGIDAEIVNGATPRQGGENRTREAIVRRFREKPGFEVLILSPDVAGIGLTLVEANHVIHYGRWWNPARESQATDRVHRIGQDREVHVYFPIARDPARNLSTFDERLDALLKRRSALAAEFLVSMPSEENLEKELLGDLLAGDPAAEAEPASGALEPLTLEDARGLAEDRFEALIAALEERQGACAVLGPRAGSGGIDVVAIRTGGPARPGEVRLVHVPKASSGFDLEAAISTARDAAEAFQRRLHETDGARTVLVTAASLGWWSRRRAARRNEVEVVDGGALRELLARFPCSLGDVEAMEGRRCRSLREMQSELVRIGVAKREAGQRDLSSPHGHAEISRRLAARLDRFFAAAAERSAAGTPSDAEVWSAAVVCLDAAAGGLCLEVGPLSGLPSFVKRIGVEGQSWSSHVLASNVRQRAVQIPVPPASGPWRWSAVGFEDDVDLAALALPRLPDRPAQVFRVDAAGVGRRIESASLSPGDRYRVLVPSWAADPNGFLCPLAAGWRLWELEVSRPMPPAAADLARRLGLEIGEPQPRLDWVLTPPAAWRRTVRGEVYACFVAGESPVMELRAGHLEADGEVVAFLHGIDGTISRDLPAGQRHLLRLAGLGPGRYAAMVIHQRTAFPPAELVFEIIAEPPASPRAAARLAIGVEVYEAHPGKVVATPARDLAEQSLLNDLAIEATPGWPVRISWREVADELLVRRSVDAGGRLDDLESVADRIRERLRRRPIGDVMIDFGELGRIVLRHERRQDPDTLRKRLAELVASRGRAVSNQPGAWASLLRIWFEPVLAILGFDVAPIAEGELPGPAAEAAVFRLLHVERRGSRIEGGVVRILILLGDLAPALPPPLAAWIDEACAQSGVREAVLTDGWRWATRRRASRLDLRIWDLALAVKDEETFREFLREASEGV
ncbi:MAG: DEAD/DEAH box helicase [Candidatus Schekmanbacteria bacterium]|nr:DEAD/DEAH box helicase [Candidatus Schekmanbacteria bacterium]